MRADDERNARGKKNMTVFYKKMCQIFYGKTGGQQHRIAIVK